MPGGFCFGQSGERVSAARKGLWPADATRSKAIVAIFDRGTCAGPKPAGNIELTRRGDLGEPLAGWAACCFGERGGGDGRSAAHARAAANESGSLRPDETRDGVDRSTQKPRRVIHAVVKRKTKKNQLAAEHCWRFVDGEIDDNRDALRANFRGITGFGGVANPELVRGDMKHDSFLGMRTLACHAEVDCSYHCACPKSKRF